MAAGWAHACGSLYVMSGLAAIGATHRLTGAARWPVGLLQRHNSFGNQGRLFLAVPSHQIRVPGREVLEDSPIRSSFARFVGVSGREGIPRAPASSSAASERSRPRPPASTETAELERRPEPPRAAGAVVARPAGLDRWGDWQAPRRRRSSPPTSSLQRTHRKGSGQHPDAGQRQLIRLLPGQRAALGALCHPPATAADGGSGLRSAPLRSAPAPPSPRSRDAQGATGAVGSQSPHGTPRAQCRSWSELVAGPLPASSTK